MKDDYEVGYKKPPKAYQFKPKQARSQEQCRRRKSIDLDLASLLDEPLRVTRGGKTISVHPHEAQLMSLGKRALKGEARAIKLFLKHCESAGLIHAVAEQTSVFELPKDVNPAVARVLIETQGLPPWDAVAYAALEAEYRRDAAHIEELYQRYIREHGYE